MATIVITGSTGGIGVPTVRRLAADGHRVFAGVRDLRKAEVFASLGTVEPILLDITDEDMVQKAAAEVAGRVGEGGVDAVVNNAGIIVAGPVELVEPADLERQFRVNVLGPAAVTRAFLPLLRAAKGRIVNVGAPTAHLPLPLNAAISASKAALTSLSTAMRGELAPFGIKVVLVEPGAAETDIFALAAEGAAVAHRRADPELVRLYAPMEAASAEVTSGMRMTDPDEVADVLVRAITTPRPRRHYRVGTLAKAAPMIARLPSGLVDAIAARAAGITDQPT